MAVKYVPLLSADPSDSRLPKDSVHKIMVEYFCTTCCNRCMKRCSRCKISYYCSSDCQQTDWPYHRQSCKLSIYSCANCNKDGCSTKCYKCKSFFYCTSVCQTRHWPLHEQICNFLATCYQLRRKTGGGVGEAYLGGAPNLFEPQSNVISLEQMKYVAAVTEIISREFGDTIQVCYEYLEAYPEETDQIERIRLEEATYKRNYYKVDGIMTATGTNQKMFNDELFTEEFFKTRWWNVLQTDRQALLDFIESNPKQGDIFKRKMFPPSPTMIFQTLKNICTSDLIYEFGKSYVGIGYVDLTPLLWGEFQNKECRKPMNFYGYDASVVVVLRSKVILELLKMDEAKIFTNSILQIWFSSCIDEAAVRALCDVLNKMKKCRANYSKEELQIIKIWLNTKPSIKKAKNNFSAYLINGNFEGVWSLKFKVDRVKFLRYLFTGCIFVEENLIYCGNPTMFSQLNGYTKIPQFENFFKSFYLGCRYLRHPQKSSLFEEICSVTEDAIRYLRSLIQKKKLICYLYQKEVEMQDLRFAALIRQKDPYMINWSNVPDYLEKNAFISFAKACSTDDTIHFVTFINWVYYIFGSVHVDWKYHRDTLENLYNSWKTRRKEREEEFNELFGNKSFYKYFREEKYEYPINEINTCLASTHRKIFEDFFLSDTMGQPLNRQREDQHIVDALSPHIFDQSCTTFSTAFSFNRDIKLHYIINFKQRFDSIKGN